MSFNIVSSSKTGPLDVIYFFKKKDFAAKLTQLPMASNMKFREKILLPHLRTIKFKNVCK
jgi:hypothetical protein